MLPCAATLRRHTGQHVKSGHVWGKENIIHNILSQLNCLIFAVFCKFCAAWLKHWQQPYSIPGGSPKNVRRRRLGCYIFLIWILWFLNCYWFWHVSHRNELNQHISTLIPAWSPPHSNHLSLAPLEIFPKNLIEICR